MRVVETGRRVVEVFRDEQLTLMAAGVAYYTIASLLPLLVIVLAVLSLFGAVDTFLLLLRAVLGPTVEQGLNAAVESTRWHGLAGGVGVLFVLWSASKVFRGLSMAFAEVYEADPDLTFLEAFLRSLLVLVVVLFALVLLTATGVVLSSVQLTVPYPTLVANAVALVVLVPGLVPLYTVLPPRRVPVRRALPGTLLAAVGLTLLQVGFYYYARSAGSLAVYGYLGAGVLFVTMIYAACLVLLAGAVLNVAAE